jgi:hypothetical protein
MMHLFNFSFWIWLAHEFSPAAYTRTYFAEWNRMHSEKHTKNR